MSADGTELPIRDVCSSAAIWGKADVVFGDLEMADASSMVIKDDHGVEQPKRCGPDHEHVNRGDGCHMVA